MPISRTRKDYILSGVVLVLLALVSVGSVYLTNPLKLRKNAGVKLLGIHFPDFQGIIMRQPRMTMVIMIALIYLCTAFVFIVRPALPFFSRPIGWSAIVISGIGLTVVGLFNHAGRHSSWFRFFILCLVLTAGTTIMTELMIFYRRLIHDRTFRSNIFHRIVFAIVCGALSGSMALAYFHKGLPHGVFLDYGTKATATTPSVPQTTPPVDSTVPTSTVTTATTATTAP